MVANERWSQREVRLYVGLVLFLQVYKLAKKKELKQHFPNTDLTLVQEHNIQCRNDLCGGLRAAIFLKMKTFFFLFIYLFKTVRVILRLDYFSKIIYYRMT